MVRTSSPGWYGAHLAEREALPLEDRRVGARELLVREPPRADLDRRGAASRSSGGISWRLARSLARARGSRHLDDLEDAPDDLLGRDLLGLGLVGEHDAVAEHVGADGLHVLGRDVAAVAQERVRARREVQRDRGARAGAVLDERRELLQALLARARASRTRRRRCSPSRGRRRRRRARPCAPRGAARASTTWLGLARRRAPVMRSMIARSSSRLG